MKHTDRDFDLPAYLLDNYYGHIDWQHWTRDEAAALAHDLHTCYGIDCDPEEVYSILAEVHAQEEAEGDDGEG